jgi:hypothetical protein
MFTTIPIRIYKIYIALYNIQNLIANIYKNNHFKYLINILQDNMIGLNLNCFFKFKYINQSN